MFNIENAIVFCILLFVGKCHCDSNRKSDFVTHTVSGRIFCDGKPVGDSHMVSGGFFNKTHHFWKTGTRSFTEGSFMFEHSIPRNVLSSEHRMYLTLETTACSDTGNVLTLTNKASLANDLGDLDFAMSDFVPHTVIGRIFCDGRPVGNSHLVYGNFGNITHRFWKAEARSYPNGTFIFEHLIPIYVLSDKHLTYLTLQSSACSKHGRTLKFENQKSTVTDLGNLDFTTKVSYKLTGAASCCEALMVNKQITIEMLKLSSDTLIWSKNVLTNNQGQFDLQIRENIRDEKFDIKIIAPTCRVGPIKLYKELTQKDNNFGTVKFYLSSNPWFPFLYLRLGINKC